jgi:hypothetical protein
MQPSMEVRWFFEGQIPAEVVKWFHASDHAPQDEPERIDVYLALPDTDDLGVKLRAGKNVEVKRRLAGVGVVDVWPGSEGYLEKWAKWSYPLDPNGKRPDVGQPIGSWLEVKKHRWTRKFEVMSGAIAEVDAASLPDEGCNLEIGELVLLDKHWSTVGFEAFGQLDTVEANLRLALAHVHKDHDLPRLPLAHSYAYPRWLRDRR